MSSHNSEFEKYLAVETAGGPSWHPDGKKIIYVYDAPGIFQIYRSKIVKGVTTWPERISFEQDRCTAPLYLKDGSLLYTRDFGGDENFQIAHVDKNGLTNWITRDLAAKHIPHLSSDTGFYYLSNSEKKTNFSLYYKPLSNISGDPEKVYSPEKGLPEICTTSSDERYIVTSVYLGNVEQEIIITDRESETHENLTKEITNKPARWEAVRYVDSDTLLVLTDFESEFMRFAYITFSGEFRKLDRIEKTLEFETEYTAWLSDFETTYFVTNEEGYSVLYSGIFSSDGVRDIKKIRMPIDGVIVSGDNRSFSNPISLSPDGKKLAVTISTGVEPYNIWIIDMKDDQSWKCTDTATAGLQKEKFVESSLHRFKSFDGLSVPYFRYIPKGKMLKAGWPAILIIHGGPESQIRPSFNPTIQFYLSSGFAVVTPNIRGSTGYGKIYLNLDNVEKRLDSIHDISELAAHLKKSDDQIDDDRLVIYGGSYGGFAVLSSITEYPDIWKAAVDIVGISNFVTFLENTADWRRPLREAEYGSLQYHQDLLEQISPIHKVDEIECPLFIIQGDNDERVPLSESVQIYERVKSKGIPVVFRRFADEGHGLSRLKNKIEAYSEVLDWLKENV